MLQGAIVTTFLFLLILIGIGVLYLCKVISKVCNYCVNIYIGIQSIQKKLNDGFDINILNSDYNYFEGNDRY